MKLEAKPSKGRRGYYTKKIAAMNNEEHEFHRNKKGIKKENKNICRQARLKKKIYIESLQQVKQRQQAEIISLKAQVAALKEKLEQRHVMPETNVDVGVRQLIAEYRELINAINSKDQNSIKRSLAILRSRFGIAGRDRVKWIEQHLLRIIQLSMPMHFRVLLKTFFSLLGGGEEMKLHRVNFSENQKQILKQMKSKIKSAKQHYHRIYQKIFQSWMQLKHYGEESQKIIDEIEDKVNHPIFIANLLMSLDNHRCRDPKIRQIYPVNFFSRLKQAQVTSNSMRAQQTIFRECDYFGHQDQQAFDLLFNDYSDYH